MLLSGRSHRRRHHIAERSAPYPNHHSAAASGSQSNEGPEFQDFEREKEPDVAIVIGTDSEREIKDVEDVSWELPDVSQVKRWGLDPRITI